MKTIPFASVAIDEDRSDVGLAKSGDTQAFTRSFDQIVSKKTATLTAGAFAGTSVEVITTSQEQRLWGKGEKLVLAVVGDLTAEEMITAANSLQ